MNKNLILTAFLGIFLLLGSSCKSEFEKIRVSGDSELLLKRAFKYYEQEEWAKAQTLFELVIGAYKGKKEAEKAYFYYAYTHYNQGKFLLSSYYFKNFANTFPNSDFREESDFMEHYSNYQLSPTYRLDQTYSEKAIDGFQLFVNTYPDSERVAEANMLIDGMRTKMEKKAFSEAELYYDLKQYQSATQSFLNLLKDFPDSPYAEKVRYLIIKSNYNLARHSVFAKQSERYNTTLKYTENFLNKHPKSKYDDEVQSILNKSQQQLKIIANVGY